MLRYILLFSFFAMTLHLSAQDLVGQWETYDDKTKAKKGLIEIYKSGNKYYGKIVLSYTGKKGAVCEKCPGDKKNQPIVGLVIIENLELDGDEYNKGTILDPESGDVYSCYLVLENENKLKVRGYLGFSLIGRTQYWTRKKQ